MNQKLNTTTIELTPSQCAIIFDENKIKLHFQDENSVLESQNELVCYAIAKLFEEQNEEFFELIEKKSREIAGNREGNYESCMQ